MSSPRIIDLGKLSYADAYAIQLAHHEEVLAARDTAPPSSHPTSHIPYPTSPDPGRILLVEHSPPVITISRRPNARAHLLATPDRLARAGVEIAETDRGGDITYHGPGQLVAYPILDLNHYHLGIHAYMRLLEQAIIDTIAKWGIVGERDAGVTGVWVRKQGERPEAGGASDSALPSTSRLAPRPSPLPPPSKIAALGVRVRRWVSMHGLALNVTTNLDHFNLIVPCGLPGRAVTSVQQILGAQCPTMDEVKRTLSDRLAANLCEAATVPSASS